MICMAMAAPPRTRAPATFIPVAVAAEIRPALAMGAANSNASDATVAAILSADCPPRPPRGR